VALSWQCLACSTLHYLATLIDPQQQGDRWLQLLAALARRVHGASAAKHDVGPARRPGPSQPASVDVC